MPRLPRTAPPLRTLTLVAALALPVGLLGGCADPGSTATSGTPPTGSANTPLSTSATASAPAPEDALQAADGVRSAHVEGTQVTLVVTDLATHATHAAVLLATQVVPGTTHVRVEGTAHAAGAGAPTAHVAAITVDLDATALSRIAVGASTPVALPDPSGALPQDPLLAADVLAWVPGLSQATIDAGATDHVLLRVVTRADLAPAALVVQAWQLPVEQVTSDDGGTLDVGPAPGRSAAKARSAGAGDARVAACAGDALDVHLLGSDAGLGHRALSVSARNTSRSVCVVDGYPAYAFTTLHGDPLDVTTSHGISYMASDPGAHRIVVPPGAAVRAVVSWDAMSTAGDPPATAVVEVTPVPGAAPVALPVAADTTAAAGQPATIAHPVGTYDILHRAKVVTTAWAPEAAAP